MDTFWFFENISESTRKISMRLRLFSVDVFWLTACRIVVLSTGSPLHPELPKPCIDQPPATLVKFGSSKVKMPFFFFFPWSTYFEFRLLGSQGVSSGEPADFQALLWLVQCLKANLLSLKQVSSSAQWYPLLWFQSERMGKPRQLCRSHLLTRELWCQRCCWGQLLAGQCTVVGMLQAGLCDRYSRSLTRSRYRLSGKMSQRVKPQA